MLHISENNKDIPYKVVIVRIVSKGLNNTKIPIRKDTILSSKGNNQKSEPSTFSFKEIWNFITLSTIIHEPIRIIKMSFTIKGLNIIVSPIIKVRTPTINCILIVLNSLNSEK